MQIIDIGDAFYVLEQIAYMSKDKDAHNRPLIKLALTGNSTIFTLSFASVEDRDKSYKTIQKMIVDYEKK